MSAARRALFVSPHLDDVAFSCGGALAALLAKGWNATVATVFTASVETPQGFALACQTDKGLAPGVDYMRLRRAEDEDFAAAVRNAVVRATRLPSETAGRLRLRHGPLEEAPHRGYDSPEALFGGVHPGDDAWQRAQAWLAALLEETPAALLFAPQALGGHVDHVHAARAVRALADAGAAPPVLWYRDLPYALREPEAAPCRWAPGGHAARAIPLAEPALAAKRRGAAAYASQIGFQFGSAAAAREALTGFAREEGRRFDLASPAEVVRGSPAAARAFLEATLTQG